MNHRWIGVCAGMLLAGYTQAQPEAAPSGEPMAESVRPSEPAVLEPWPEPAVPAFGTVPPGMTPLPVRPVAPTGATVTGQVIRFGAVAEVRPNEVLTYRVPVRADRAGRMRVEVNVSSRTELQAIVVSEETSVFNEN